MKIVELVNKLNITIPISNEEHDLLKKFGEDDVVLKSALDPREQHVANSLVHKDILLRQKNENGKILFKRKLKS